MDRGLYGEAIADFEESLRLVPAFGLSAAHLAGARFLDGDAEGPIDTTARAVGGPTSPLSPSGRESALETLENLRAQARKAATPAETARLAENLAGLLTFAASQSGAEPRKGPWKLPLTAILNLLQR
jgi:hypothetical protein